MKNLMLAATFLLASTVMVAQPHGQPRGKKAEQIKERIETARIAFLTKELELTSEEAQVFWPVFNEYQAKLKEVKDKYGKNRPGASLEDIDEMTDKEALKAMESHKAQMEELHAVRAKYHEEFMKILSPKKVLKLYAAEREFKQHILQRMRQRQGGHNGKPGQHGQRGGERGGPGGHGPHGGAMGGGSHGYFMY